MQSETRRELKLYTGIQSPLKITATCESLNENIPGNRYSTLLSIEYLKGTHLGGTLITIVIRKICEMQVIVPLCGVVHDIHLKHVLDNLVYSLSSVSG